MLRTRLFLNLLPFVVILLAVGSYAVILYSQLARDVEIRVAESYGSLQAAQEMSLALAGMESDIWLATTQSKSNRATFVAHQQRFEQNLAAQLKSESLPGAKELNEQLNADYRAFRLALARLHASTNAVRRGIYQQAVVPAALKLQASLKKIRDLNHEIILGTSSEIQAITREVMRLMILGLAIALIVSAYACYRLSRSILQPIQSLTQATRKLGEGEWEHPVPVNSRDELSELATAFNKMAAQLQEYRQSTTDEIVRLHRTMETTLASFPDPIFVLDENGRIQLKNPPAQNLAASLGLEHSLPERLHAIATGTLASGRDFLPHSFADVVCYRVNAGEKSFLPRVLAMHDKHDALLGVAVVLYDVTRFRLLDAAKSNLVATVSHE
jgi:nitrogen fixation/metabolism regulation signal transduction histidine kinase